MTLLLALALAQDTEFPIAVWLQSPRNAAAYKAAGINTYVGLWEGPTAEQLDALKAAGLKVVCHQNAVALARKDDPTILAWMHGDEPDNAQAKDGGYGPPILPSKIVEDYAKLKAADRRPVLLNLGQGVAWDGWIGRGTRTNKPEDYPEYLKGCDIASFDIYPAVHDAPAVAGKLEFVAKGVERLRRWTDGKKPVWTCIEASRIDNVKTKPAPAQIRAEVWMAIIHGATGLIYFVHQFKPRFDEASLLHDAELLKAVTEINRQVRELAPVLNGPTATDVASATNVALLTKRHGGATYLFACEMKGAAATARFTVKGATADVLGESRTLKLRDGGFEDAFGPYEVHLYRLN
ncbi:MAG TPA: hypothetical protein VF950_10015 [Planctomycetota bacterium]